MARCRNISTTGYDGEHETPPGAVNDTRHKYRASEAVKEAGTSKMKTYWKDYVDLSHISDEFLRQMVVNMLSKYSTM